MNLVLTINLTGSALVLGMALLKKIYGDKVSRRQFYFLSRISVLCFLVPMRWLGEIYKTILMELFTLVGIRYYDGKDFFGSRDFITLKMGKRLILSKGLRVEGMVIGAYFIVAIVLFLFTLCRQAKKISGLREVLKQGFRLKDAEADRIAKQYGIRRAVALVACGEKRQTATIGILHPIVLLPEKCDWEEKRWILSHELYHVKRFDTLWLVLLNIVKCLWFVNPLVYYLEYQFRRYMEQSCDEFLLEGKSIDEKKAYFRMVMESVDVIEEEKEESTLKNQNSMKKLEERIRIGMRAGRSMGKNRSWVTIILCLFFCSLTTIAYQDVHYLGTRGEDATLEDYFNGNDNITVGVLGEGDLPFGEKDPIAGLPEGLPGDGDETDVICLFHEYEPFAYYTHEPDGNGGCTVKIYDAEKCRKCGKIKNAVLRQTIISNPCPH